MCSQTVCTVQCNTTHGTNEEEMTTRPYSARCLKRFLADSQHSKSGVLHNVVLAHAVRMLLVFQLSQNPKHQLGSVSSARIPIQTSHVDVVCTRTSIQTPVWHESACHSRMSLSKYQHIMDCIQCFFFTSSMLRLVGIHQSRDRCLSPRLSVHAHQ